jgi:signal transduction histidine kinase
VLRAYGIPLAGFTIVGVLSALHRGYYWHVSGRPVLVGDALAIECAPWILWALCVPAVTRWIRPLRLEWPPSVRVVLAHLGGMTAATIVFAVAPLAVEELLGRAPATEVWSRLRDNLVYAWSSGSIAYGATLGFAHAAAHAERSRQLLEVRGALDRAQLTALRMQLNPHFFFNTLHTIGALVRDGNNQGAVEMIERLGNVLRRVLRTDDDLETPLHDELELLRTYLEIEQVRFGDRLHVAWQIDPESESLLVPQLILQPLVENALRHGLSRRARPGSLTITARVEDEHLQLAVADDGEGLPVDFAARSDDGVGLANVRARLSQMYGETARLSLVPGEPCGVTASIVLPVRAARSTEVA